MAILPPTCDSVKQHSFKVYHQVQEWRGTNLPPTDWGWKLVQGSLLPVISLKEPAPSHLLQLMSCKCKRNCSKKCECATSGFQCSAMCGQCRGIACANSLHTLNNFIDDVISIDSDAQDIVAAVDTASGTDDDENKADNADITIWLLFRHY